MSEEHQILLEGRILEATRDRAKQEVVIDLIREGFGNQRDGHYYSKGLLEASAAKFNGALMYVDHLDPDAQKKLGGLPRPVRDLGGRILQETVHVAQDEESGKTVLRGTAKIAQPWLWAMVEADPELLGVSIHAGGQSKAGQAEGRSAKIVESISSVRSVDWVTQAGAGGKVVGLIEAQIAADEEAVQEREDEITTQEPVAQEEAVAEAETQQEDAVSTIEAKGAPIERCADKWWALREGESLTAEAVDVLFEAIDDSDQIFEGAQAKADLEPDEGSELPAEITEAWSTWCEFVESDPTRAKALAEEWEFVEAETETTETETEVEDEKPADEENTLAPIAESDLEERAIALAQERLETAVSIATQALKEQYDEQLAEAQAEFDRKLEDASARYDRGLAQRDQRIIAGQLIEKAGFKPPTERALKEQFFDAFFEAEQTDDGKTIPGDDVCRREVKSAIDERRRELSAYVESRVSGIGESESTSVVEAGATNPGGRAKAPLDQEIDKIIGI